MKTPPPSISTMPASGGPGSGATAATITVPELLRLLDCEFTQTAAAVANAQYAFWIGSGISRGRVDDLKALIRRALHYLSARVDPGAPEYERALAEVLELTALSSADRQAIDVRQDPASWKGINDIESSLVEKYSVFLDIRIPGQAPDYLLWEAADAASVFGAPRDPDSEHLCLAILALEGTAPAIISANWDGLVEAAFDQLGAELGVLAVCVKPDDLRTSGARSTLLKFHGCAVRAIKNPADYRELLVARISQIVGWRRSPDHKAMRAAMEHFAMAMHTLMIGLSAQDTNIQDLFDEARDKLDWKWPCQPPAYVFAGSALTPSQKTILACGYGKTYDKSPADIESHAFLRAYGKPLLLSLVLHVICAKLQQCADRRATGLTPVERGELARGIQTLRDAVGAQADPNSVAFVHSLWRTVARAMCLLQEGVVNTSAYRPISGSPANVMLGDANTITSGLYEAAVVLALLGDGQANGHWVVLPGDLSHAEDGTLTIQAAGHKSRVFLAANGSSYVALIHSGLVGPSSGDAIVFHSSDMARRRRRSPKGALGRTGQPKLREVVVPSLLSGATSINDLRTRFRQEAAL